ncbi:MAG: hypothetical protein IIT65_11385 [Lachnospiraceae bacterium]|nr:hypothetical protein [Lachnospiraceae bacterium]
MKVKEKSVISHGESIDRLIENGTLIPTMNVNEKVHYDNLKIGENYNLHWTCYAVKGDAETITDLNKYDAAHNGVFVVEQNIQFKPYETKGDINIKEEIDEEYFENYDLLYSYYEIAQDGENGLGEVLCKSEGYMPLGSTVHTKYGIILIPLLIAALSCYYITKIKKRKKHLPL